jgi:hypothetical protein
VEKVGIQPLGLRSLPAVRLVSDLGSLAWNFVIPSIPHPPPPEKLGSMERVKLELIPRTTRSGYSRYLTKRGYLAGRICSLALSTVLQDAVTTFAAADPFFVYGLNSDGVLPPALSSISSPLLHIVRGITVLTGSYALVFTILGYVDIIQYFLGGYFFPVRREPWYHSSLFGSPTGILNRGLAGFWGVCWHQTFRVNLTAPVIWLERHGFLRRGSSSARIALYCFAFLNSALMHAAGSFTAVPTTKPHHHLLFFSFAVIGVVLQQAFCRLFRVQLATVPLGVRQIGNALFVMAWLALTYLPLAQDFIDVDIFIAEPVPVSIVRGLGFGVEEDRAMWWNRWDRGYWPTWYKGSNWWNSGIALGT